MTACIFHDTEASLHNRRVFEIVEDAYNRKVKAVVFAGSEERATEIDRFLWIMRQESFIPHKVLLGREAVIPVPVAIITTEWRPYETCIFIADGHCSQEFACSFDIIHEFVYRSSPAIQEICRNRFRSYRDKDIPVEYLKTGVWKGVVSKE